MTQNRQRFNNKVVMVTGAAHGIGRAIALRFGSEGALTKAAFNALPPVVDLNNALVSFILTGYAGFTTSAGSLLPRISIVNFVPGCRCSGET